MQSRAAAARSKRRKRQKQKIGQCLKVLDSDLCTRIIAIVSSSPPEEHKRWTLSLIVDHIFLQTGTRCTIHSINSTLKSTNIKNLISEKPQVKLTSQERQVLKDKLSSGNLTIHQLRDAQILLSGFKPGQSTI